MSVKYATNTIIKGLGLSALILLLALGANTIMAQEHPAGHEHPSSGPSAMKSQVTTESLAKAITDYVNKVSKLQGGYFLFFDKIQNKPLALSLEDVHKDRLGDMGDGTYFACADFKDTGGDTYDMDIFMKKDKAGMEASDISVHKKNGEARYDWVENNGVWSRKAK